MKAAVIVFPGSNCDRDCKVAIERSTGAQVEMVWHAETALPDGLDLIVLPGGFSYGDYLRCGAMASLSPAMAEVKAAAERGVATVGICNGFQVLCEAHLLPGALLRNAQQRFAARPVDVRIERTDTVVTADYAQGEVIRIPIAHGEGRYAADDATLNQLEQDGRILMRYVAVPGSDAQHNPNGSARDIAGICNAAGTVVGFMPHPERLAESALGSDAGHRCFTSLVSRLAVGATA